MTNAHEPRQLADGAEAELAVARYLQEQGFELVALNLRLGHYELDVVARRGELVVVVEVRFRSNASWTTGFGSILPEKRRRVQRAAQRLWRARYARDPSVTRLRIDAAAVGRTADGRYAITYCPGAFSGL